MVALGSSAFKNISRCFFGDLAAISKCVFERSISPKYSTEEREISLSCCLWYTLLENLPIEHSVVEWFLLEHISQIPERLVREALATAQAFKNGTAWLQAKTALLLRLAELGYAQDALDMAHAIWGETLPVKVQVMLTPYLTKVVRLQEILTVTQALQTKAERMSVLRTLVLGGPRLPSLSLSPVYHLWHEIFRLRATDGRRELLSDLAVLLPILDRLGTVDVWNETADAIIDAAHWWP